MIKGLQEYISHKNNRTTRADLFCGNCGEIIKLNYKYPINKIALECDHCKEINEFKKDSNVREFSNKHYFRKRPIAYWARKYSIPENSCYMVFRKRGIGIKSRTIGAAKLMTQRDFLAYALYTKRGAIVVSNLIKSNSILTE